MAFYVSTRTTLYRYGFLNLMRHYRKAALVTEYKVSRSALPHETNKNITESSDTSIYKRREQYESTPALLPSQVEEQRVNDLNNSILSAENFKNVFNIYLKNKPCYELHQYLHTTKRLSELLKMGRTSSKQLHQTAIFQCLCYDIWKRSSQMEANMSLSFYRNLWHLKLNSNSLLMQSLLQMIRHQINLFNIKELLLLYTLLHHTEPCVLRTALHLAVPKAIEHCIQDYLSPKLKFTEACQLLRICIDAELQGLSAVLSHFFRVAFPQLLSEEEHRPPSTANPPSSMAKVVSLSSNLLNLFLKTNVARTQRDLNIAHTLLLHCVDFLEERALATVDRGLVLLLVGKMAKCVLTGRNEHVLPWGFQAAVVRKCVAEKWDLGDAAEVARIQLSLNRVSDELISYAISGLVENFDEVNRRQLNISPIISSMPFTTNSVHQLPSHGSLLPTTRFVVPNHSLEIPWIKLKFTPSSHLQCSVKGFLEIYSKNGSDQMEERDGFVSSEHLPATGLQTILAGVDCSTQGPAIAVLVTREGEVLFRLSPLTEAKGDSKLVLIAIPSESNTCVPQLQLGGCHFEGGLEATPFWPGKEDYFPKVTQVEVYELLTEEMNRC